MVGMTIRLLRRIYASASNFANAQKSQNFNRKEGYYRIGASDVMQCHHNVTHFCLGSKIQNYRMFQPGLGRILDFEKKIALLNTLQTPVI